jgi:hypothetical protein
MVVQQRAERFLIAGIEQVDGAPEKRIADALVFG